MDRPVPGGGKGSRERKGWEVGESSGARHHVPAPLPSFNRWSGVAVPLPEPRTPRTSRNSEKRRLQKLYRLEKQAATLNEEISQAKQAPRVSITCKEVAEFIESRGREDPFVTNHFLERRLSLNIESQGTCVLAFRSIYRGIFSHC
ncbi:uncharacterized protein LOC112345142 isoform X1 [Selaginella moellendorffii]|uniref:uncharacterized protein LOC112345142 isoform X1 n=1 Tax=Selaginella moellendorffii TaxID=88036 RepID=UPI000D1CE2AF|nr:uncharacterized protein LOC112345142 isoform X1 [Selaginella moellendorffii]|eukprot:XP_024527067.1 uncharacterized protein LOC112345142 isoform X1 [Selaginella moellendorffii]